MSEKSENVPTIAVRCGQGVLLLDGHESYKEWNTPRDDTKTCRLIKFSPKGNFFTWIVSDGVRLFKCSNWETVITINKPKVMEIAFSPLDSYLLLWEPFTTNEANPKGSPNLHIFSTADGSLVRSFISKKQAGWQPQWTGDEKIFSRLNGTDVEFYEDGNFERHSNRLSGGKVASFSLSGNCAAPYHVSTFVTGTSGQPAFCRLFEYPKFDTCLASKSFFQGDRVDYYWNPRGNSLLAMSIADVDKTGGSYYGKQSLHHLDVKGNSATLHFSKEGPVHAVCWSPAVGVSEFCVVYGHQPAKSTLFNTRCQPVFEFGTGPKNAVYFSPDGSRLLLGGFGNLSQGSIDIFRLGSGGVFSGERSATKTASLLVPGTTLLQWDPRSESFITATTMPRLRIDNGLKVWHYTGALLYARNFSELYDAAWQTGSFPPSILATTTPVGLTGSPQKVPKSEPYRPPGARGLTKAVKLHDDEVAPHKPGQGPNDAPPSKTALKQRKKREAKKARKAEEQDGIEVPDSADSPTAETVRPIPINTNADAPFVSTGDPDKDKKIKNLNKKLADIAKLKEKKLSGVTLELNQRTKIESEKALLSELAKLRL